jgi:hypothetical protein
MVSATLPYPILNEHSSLFAACLAFVLAVSVGLFFLSRWRVSGTIVAIVFTVVWVVLLLPDLQYYFGTRNLNPAEWIIEPFYRDQYVRGYILVLLPVPFVLFGMYARRQRTI